MAVYASMPRFAERRRHPRALLLIIAGHAALVAAVMTVRMDLPVRLVDPPTRIEILPIPEDPPPEPKPEPRRPSDPVVDRPTVIVPVTPRPQPPLATLPQPIPMPDPGAGTPVDPGPAIEPTPRPAPVRTGPRFATPPDQVRPPYPPSKIQRDEEASLRLRLTIDARGRVTAVEPVGRADPAFLEAARRHIMARWRYRPATEDGTAIAASTVVTLRFELD